MAAGILGENGTGDPSGRLKVILHKRQLFDFMMLGADIPLPANLSRAGCTRRGPPGPQSATRR